MSLLIARLVFYDAIYPRTSIMDNYYMSATNLELDVGCRHQVVLVLNLYPPNDPWLQTIALTLIIIIFAVRILFILLQIGLHGIQLICSANKLKAITIVSPNFKFLTYFWVKKTAFCNLKAETTLYFFSSFFVILDCIYHLPYSTILNYCH